jgi:hypothetical protein
MVDFHMVISGPDPCGSFLLQPEKQIEILPGGDYGILPL